MSSQTGQQKTANVVYYTFYFKLLRKNVSNKERDDIDAVFDDQLTAKQEPL